MKTFLTNAWARLREIPYVSLLLAAAAGALFLAPAATAALQFERAALAAGQAWRILTCHWTHFNLDQLVWNALPFAFLGGLCEREDRRRFLACLAGSALLLPLAVYAFVPTVKLYRGLSGVDSALFALLSASILREKVAARSWGWVVACACVLAGFFGKVVFEMATGATFFVDSAAAGMVPLPLVHVLGAAIGILAGVPNRRSR
ncbi:MAG: rhombosortase [Planctomycetes bacterium]|nr:rhombosortase [Planctomycetota bacterium]